MIKVDLITGILGSGKTTFLLKYARHLMKQGLKIGILEYDYSAINVDMLLLNKLRCDKCEIEMLAAACDSDCLMRRFKTKLISMAMSGYDRVIIEPSGIFDMDQFFDTLRDDPLEKWYEIGSVLTIVNGGLDDNTSVEEDYLLASQAVDAGCVILSRTQMTSKEQLKNTIEHLNKAAINIKCNNFVGKFIEKNWDDFDENDYNYFMNCGYYLRDFEKFVYGNNDFSSVCSLFLPNDLEGFKKKIKLLFSSNEFGNVFRIKGVVCDGGPSYLVNATKSEMIVEPIGIGQKVVIVIGSNLKEDEIKLLIEKENID